MKQRSLFFCIVYLLFCLVTSCNQTEDLYNLEHKELSKNPSFISYSFLRENNSSLSQNYIGEIIGDSLIVLNCYHVNDVKSLIPTFEGNFTSVTINGAPQYSGITKNDYSDDLLCHLKDSVGNERFYKIIVNH